MEEIEVKILEIDRREVEERLRQLNAELIFKGRIETIYFDRKDGKLGDEGKVLRLRKREGRNFITLKVGKSRKRAKIMDEYEMEINDFEVMKSILNGLGFYEIYRLEKHRTSYRLDSSRCEIDDYPDIPVFLEVESPDLKTLERDIERLGFNEEDTTSYSIRDVLKYYDRENF